MIFRKNDSWELWGNAHPSEIECLHGDSCDCKYHIVDIPRTEIYGYDDFQDADAQYCKLSGENKFDHILINRL